MYNILLVEDDVQICEIISDYFARESGGDMIVTAVHDGEDGVEAYMTNVYDMVLLDIMLPKMDGFSVCRRLRRHSMAPILFLTGRSSETDIMTAYDLGCDDYIVKPFRMTTLYAKCRALIKRSKGMTDAGYLVCGDIALSPSTYTVKVKGSEIELAPKEFALLKLLMENKEVVLDRDRILTAIWGYDYEGSDRCVDNHVRKLRKSLGSAGRLIKTVIGKGYQMKEI